MPTPIEHLAIAEQLWAAPTLLEAVRTWLEKDEAVCGAFLFGHIAPDVQVVSRQPRETTHFFAVPPTNHHLAYERMLAAHPLLARPSTLPAAQAAFLAGYMAHLLLDELWVREIFSPVFGPEQGWGDWRERLLLHNVLRTWLARRDLPRLRDGIGALLRQAQPDGWLPFVTDDDLCRWRDQIADQFEPDTTIRTVEVFAGRARISDAEFLALLEPDVLRERIFSRVPLAALDAFQERAVARSHDLTVRYLSGCMRGEFE